MNLSFCIVAFAASGVCLTLALLWLVFPQFLLWIWRVDSPEPALLVARRGGALFLGVGAMLFLARDAESSPARRAIATGLSISCATLAALGLYEFAAGHAGVGIFLAIVVELALATAFFSVRHTDRPPRKL
ncbi:hypothetical protein [Methylocella sp.]|jgi:peptidoglycan/LPS O-acetylase OafA/YrhL|uniref:hypothetical protein n=1 Tax=Methylocella sp. TaxID=1978226 RepID=UPI003C23425D